MVDLVSVNECHPCFSEKDRKTMDKVVPAETNGDHILPFKRLDDEILIFVHGHTEW